ncbi:MAG: FAD-dependent oxidoreductase [Alphaproteobacteria bacterium]|nr:FAD-dependent oxidoreductase [Alphaproteobacteria bacterium]
MRVAVVGAGISGFGAALSLQASGHDVTLFEKDARLGGHAHTVTVDYDGVHMPVDTGFIVFNCLNYPNLVAMLAHLNVATFESDMSFAVSDPHGFEWSSNGLSGLFAWKRNLARPGFLGMLSDIVRFSAAARADLAGGRIAAASLGDYVDALKLSKGFLQNYLLPMGAAIWSTPEDDVLDYPAETFLRFCDNHRLLHAKRPRWRSIVGGSRSYVTAAAKALGGAVRSGDPVVDVRRLPAGGVLLRTQSGHETRYDHVILACHSDEALALLSDADGEERAALAAVRYAPNRAYLHRDPGLMPRRRAAWASWNYLRAPDPVANEKVCVTYWMNLLQNLDETRPVFVTLNPATPPREELTFGVYDYAHPQFDLPAVAAQKAIKAMNGRNGVSFAGAWLGYGFHEDGLSSGLAAAAGLGAAPPWANAAAAAETTPLSAAAA